MSYNLGAAVNAALVAVAFRPAQAASMWFPNIEFRNLNDVIDSNALDAGTNPAFGQYGYRATMFYDNSFLHTVGRFNQGAPLPVSTVGNDWPSFMSRGFMNPRLAG